MSAIKSAALLTAPSRQLVVATIADAVTFLRIVGKHPAIRQQLATAGYTDAETERGFALIHDVIIPRTQKITDNPVAAAFAELEAWRTTGFVIACSALVHLHPAEEAFLLDGLDLGNAALFVTNLSFFLERCSQLETGKDRKASHKADLAALATLEARGFTKAERKRLGALVTMIETHAAPLPEEEPDAAETEARFNALRGWLLDWRGVAKVVITRRDWLLALGIGKRRPKKAVLVPVPAPDPVVTPTPMPAPTPVPAPAPAAPAPVAPPVLAAHVDEGAGPQSRAA